MFSASLRTTLILVAIATAVSVSAAPGLSLKVTGPAAVDGVENLKVVGMLTNTGDETLKLLNDPNSILSTLPADTFSITTDDGASPSFTGVRVKYSPSQAAKLADASVFTVLEPGATVSITHDLSSAYNLTSTGHSTYTIKAATSFYAVNANGGISTLTATSAEPFSATLTGGKLVVVHRHHAGPGRPAHGKRATFTDCSPVQEAQLVAAAFDAQDYATLAASYLGDNTTGTPRYNAWFGAYDATRHGTALRNFRSIAGSSNDFDAYSYDCGTCTVAGAFAYVNTTRFGVVYLCPLFWTAPPVGTDSKAGTLIHEASHFPANGGTQDYVYGQAASRALAQSNPDRAILNADNYQYFAENDPVLQ